LLAAEPIHGPRLDHGRRAGPRVHKIRIARTGRALHKEAMRSIMRYLLRGTLVVVPTTVTLYVVYLAFSTLDRVLPLGVPGLGLVVTLGLITLIGLLSSNVIGKTLVDELESLVGRLPLVKLVYTSIKDLMSAFVGDKKRFDRPVSVSLVPGGALRALGFVTRDDLSSLGLSDYVAVYFPQSYNFAGNMVLVHRGLVEPLGAHNADVMTFIISGGVSGCDGGVGLDRISQPGG
jgi:uncharacterized membrane protein